jgi:DNA polymerase III delta subunit
MIILLHGDNTISSRTELTNLLKQYHDQGKDIEKLNGDQLDLIVLQHSVETANLFSPKVTVIENIFSQRVSKEKNSLITYLGSLDVNQTEMVIWEKKEVSKTWLKKAAANWVVKKYPLPSLIFNLTDSLAPNNQPRLLQLYHQCRASLADELVFFMLCRRLREMLLVSLGEKIINAPWEVAKITRQAKNFTTNQLLNSYQQLLKIDYSIKTGQTDLSLGWHLDLWLARL